MSTVSESNPWCAMISAENELGIDSQPFTTASPRAQIALSVFSLTWFSLFGEGGSAPLSTPPRTRGALGLAPLSTPSEHAGRFGAPPLDSPAKPQVSSGRHTTRKLHQRQILSSS